MRGLALFSAAGLMLAACEAATPSPGGQASSTAPIARVGQGQLELTGRVVDGAALLSAAQESRLTQLSERLEARTSDQLVVVTVPSLQERSIEDYTRELAMNWGVGHAGKNNGVVLLLAPSERQVRIEVGAGLESVLTNALAQEIIDSDLLPMFREARWFEGLEAGAESIFGTLVEQANEPRGRS